MQDLRDYKQSCLFDEHATLSSFVEKEIVTTALVRSLCVAAWVVGALAWLGSHAPAAAAALALLAAIAAFWLIDLFFSYFGVIYKMRRLRVREWIDRLPAAETEELASWRTPANPFDGLGRAEKLSALGGAVASPVVFSVYGLLVAATAVVYFLA